MTKKVLRIVSSVIFIMCCSFSLFAKEHSSWEDYIKKNKYKCPGPLDTLKSPKKITLAGKKYSLNGHKLIINKKSKDKDKEVRIGVVSAIKDMLPKTKKNLEQSIQWFKENKVEWLIVNGDSPADQFNLETTINILAMSDLPILFVLGNTDNKNIWRKIYKERLYQFPNIINTVFTMHIVADDVEFLILPGYHDPIYSAYRTGCLYRKEDLDKISKKIKFQKKSPLLFVSHGPPRGKNKNSIDRTSNNVSVGDPNINKIISKHNISFGIFSHILESGGRAVGKKFSKKVEPNHFSSHLYINSGTLSSSGWILNNKVISKGIAMIFTIKNKKAKYQVKYF